MQNQNTGSTPAQTGHQAHEQVSDPGQGVGGQDAPAQAGHQGSEGAFGQEAEHHPTPDGQVEAGQNQMSAGQTAEKSQMADD